MSSVRRALFFSLIEKYATIVLSLASNLIVARILTPAEIGIFAVAASIVGIAQVIRDFGIGNYLIQEADLTHAKIRSAFGISLLLGLVLFAVFWVGAGAIASFYADTRLATVIQVIAVNFLILPFCSISLALLRRAMRFDVVMHANILGAIFSFAVTVGMIYAGFGAVSLAAGAITNNVVTGAVAWLRSDERKLLLPGFSEWRSIVDFGGQNTLAGIVVSASMDANDLVVGKVIGFGPVAILSRAQGLMNMLHRDLLGAVRNVAFPAFAKAHREGQDVEAQFIKSVSSISAFAWPFYVFIALFPLEILRIMFGAQWDEAAPLVPIFSLAGAVAAIGMLIPNLLTAIGRYEVSARTDILSQFVRVILVVLATVSYESLPVTAVAFALSNLLGTGVFLVAKRRCGLRQDGLLWSALLRSGLVTGLASFIPATLSIYAGVTRHEPLHWGLFALASIATAVSWLWAIHACRHPIAAEPIVKKIVCVLRVPFRT